MRTSKISIRNIIMPSFILSLVLIAVISCTQLPRYDTGTLKVNLPGSIYTDDIDPNDPMYKLMSGPPESWSAQFGNSERAAFGYQHALARQQRAELRQMIIDVNDLVGELTDTQLWIMKVIGRDPNSN